MGIRLNNNSYELHIAYIGGYISPQEYKQNPKWCNAIMEYVQ